MKHMENSLEEVIEYVENRLSIGDYNFIRELNNWASDRELIYLINQWVIQINNEATMIEKSRNKKDISSLIKEKERFNKILKRAEWISKKRLEKVYK